MTGALRAEWTKARTVPSTGWLLLLVVLAMVGVGFGVTSTLRIHDCGQDPCVLDTTKLSLAGVHLAQVGAGILGVLLATSEYTTGTISPTLAAVPRRWAVLTSKCAVAATLVAGAAAVGVVGALLAARSRLPGRGFTAATGYPDSTVLQSLTQRGAVGTVLYLVLITLLGLGIGHLVRDTGAAVTLLLTLLFVAPLVAMFVSDTRWQLRIHRYAPTDAGLVIQSTRDLAGQPIAPWWGMALLAGYTLTAVVAGAIALRARDATRLPG